VISQEVYFSWHFHVDVVNAKSQRKKHKTAAVQAAVRFGGVASVIVPAPGRKGQAPFLGIPL